MSNVLFEGPLSGSNEKEPSLEKSDLALRKSAVLQPFIFRFLLLKLALP